MDGNSYVTYTYRLRSAGAVPIGPGSFLAQTFGGEKNKVTSYEATTTLPSSDEFMGASVDANYMQANFQRLPYLTSAGRQIFSGTVTERPEFIEESQIPGQGGF
jgi:hypothetical protein